MENKKEIVKQNIFNDGTFENMLNNTEAIYDLEARHIPTYIWQLMSKELIIKQNSKSPEEQQEFDIIMRVHLISDDESIPPMQSQNYDEQKEFVISNWKKELDSIFKIINIFDKKTDIEKTTVVLSKERRLNNEEIWQYFQNRSHATTPNHINKTLYEWEEQTGY